MFLVAALLRFTVQWSCVLISLYVISAIALSKPTSSLYVIPDPEYICTSVLG